MNIDQIKKIISETPLKKIKVIKTKCRPPEKSNKILVVKIGGENWYCERPSYYWSYSGQSFTHSGFTTEGERVFPKKEFSGFFDERGLWWTTYKLSSLFLLSYYFKNPLCYASIMSRHMVDIQKIISILKKVHKNMNQEEKLEINIKHLAEAYNLFYLYPSAVFFVFDELVYQFKLFLLKYFDKKTTNIYLTKFLQAEITKEIIKKSYGEKLSIAKPDTRDVLYASGSEPLVYYRRPRFFHEFPDDMDILEKLVKKNISNKELKKFYAFRWIVPVSVQVNEEAQYVESQMLSAHTSYIMKKAASRLGKKLDDLEQMTYQSIIEKLEKEVQ